MGSLASNDDFHEVFGGSVPDVEADLGHLASADLGEVGEACSVLAVDAEVLAALVLEPGQRRRLRTAVVNTRHKLLNGNMHFSGMNLKSVVFLSISSIFWSL